MDVDVGPGTDVFVGPGTGVSVAPGTGVLVGTGVDVGQLPQSSAHIEHDSPIDDSHTPLPQYCAGVGLAVGTGELVGCIGVTVGVGIGVEV